MKTLILVRHAKSSWEMNVPDWQRQLTEAGIARAEKVAAKLRSAKIAPDKIITSHALRALNTAVIFAVALKFPTGKLEVSSNIYEKSAGSLLDLLQGQDDRFETIMLFAHNPGISDLCNLLTGGTSLEMTTSCAVCLTLEINSWRDSGAAVCKAPLIETGKL